MNRSFLTQCTALLFLAVTIRAPAAESGTRFGVNLLAMHRTHQALRADKEACDEAFPGTKAANEKSYASWRARNAKLLSELDEDLLAMIKRDSKDQKDFVRNVARSESALLQLRTDTKQKLLSLPRDELEIRCRELPGLLSSKESDLETLYAEELKSIRSRR